MKTRVVTEMSKAIDTKELHLNSGYFQDTAWTNSSLRTMEQELWEFFWGVRVGPFQAGHIPPPQTGHMGDSQDRSRHPHMGMMTDQEWCRSGSVPLS